MTRFRLQECPEQSKHVFNLIFLILGEKMHKKIGLLKIFFVFLICADLLGHTSYAVSPANQQNHKTENKNTSGFHAYYTRTDSNDAITGKYPDIIVTFGDKGKFVFSGSSSYWSYWETAKGKWYVDQIILRKGSGTKLRPDKYNGFSYAKIIKNDPGEVIVQWRYYPDIQKIGLTDVVHEFYIITPDGKVQREIKMGTKTIDDWNDPENKITQILRLNDDGIKVISYSKASNSEKKNNWIAGSTVKPNQTGTPVAYWTFDEGMNGGSDMVKDSVSGFESKVEGNKSYWIKGVSGTALLFDGYFSCVKMPVQNAPQVNSLTIETWIAMKAHPFGLVPIVEQADWGKMGYYFGVNAHGQLGFMANLNGEWFSILTEKQLQLERWTQVAVSFSSDKKTIKLYIDGKKEAEKNIDIKDEIRLIHANSPLSIGLNTEPLIALPKERFVYGQYECITGFYGAIDEVRIFTNALSPDDIIKSYSSLKPDEKTLNNPGFHKRILPGDPGYAKKFGTEYTKLKYDEMYDDSWRSSKYSDVIVKFDELPASVVFWRGTSYGAGWVTENNLWMIDQSAETGDAISYTEHMSDKKGVYSHVKIIENTNARAVIDWRYNCNDVLYSFNKNYGDAGLWVDEYITIYPDGVAVRKVEQKALSYKDTPPNKVSWQDVQFLAQPGMTPDDVMNLKAVYLADLKGDTASMDFTNGIPKKSALPDANIELINMKSDYKVFLAFQEGTHITPWGNVSKEMYCHFMTWNHWPVSFITSQGKSSLFPDRVTHSAGIGAADDAVDHGNMAMYGFTNKPIKDLIPLVKSWNNPPPINRATGVTFEGYDKSQRAYIFKNASSSLTFKISATGEEPLYNPCFVIKGWGERGKAGIKIDDKVFASGKDFRQGLVYDTDGTKSLVVWIKKVSNGQTSFSITSVDDGSIK
jgi:Concanavalin A-like lectin/glucanases superfamily